MYLTIHVPTNTKIGPTYSRHSRLRIHYLAVRCTYLPTYVGTWVTMGGGRLGSPHSFLHGLTVGWAKAAFGILTAWLPSLTDDSIVSIDIEGMVVWLSSAGHCDCDSRSGVGKTGQNWIHRAEQIPHQRAPWLLAAPVAAPFALPHSMPPMPHPLDVPASPHLPCRLPCAPRAPPYASPPNATLCPDVPPDSPESRRRDRHGCTISTTTALRSRAANGDLAGLALGTGSISHWPALRQALLHHPIVMDKPNTAPREDGRKAGHCWPLLAWPFRALAGRRPLRVNLHTHLFLVPSHCAWMERETMASMDLTTPSRPAVPCTCRASLASVLQHRIHTTT